MCTNSVHYRIAQLPQNRKIF